MITVVGVRFKEAGKIYYFNPGEHEIKKGDKVIVETARGVEFGHVVVGLKKVDEEEIVPPLKDVIRVANREDCRTHKINRRKAEEAFDICLEKIDKHGLEMKLIDAEYTFDNNKVIFYFTADGRVDFRELVKDLASVFRTRIELRQIGVRDEAKMIGGLGPCGKETCCTTFLGDFDPVSIKMAKEQDLSLNPTKISGLCGRLMCCLKYEHHIYDELLDKMPEVGSIVLTPLGKATVIEVYTLLETVKVRGKLEDDTEDFFLYNVDDLEILETKEVEESPQIEENFEED